MIIKKTGHNCIENDQIEDLVPKVNRETIEERSGMVTTRDRERCKLSFNHSFIHPSFSDQKLDHIILEAERQEN